MDGDVSNSDDLFLGKPCLTKYNLYMSHRCSSTLASHCSASHLTAFHSTQPLTDEGSSDADFEGKSISSTGKVIFHFGMIIIMLLKAHVVTRIVNLAVSWLF